MKKEKLNQITVTNPYLTLPPLCYDKVNPTPLKNPFLIHANSTLADEIGLESSELTSDEFVTFVNGDFLLKGSQPFAMCYAGHQFGYFVERLGDGRAINIGTIGKSHLQLKGAGLTLYSRGGDGRAVLRSSIREYLMSEAIHGLNIPTSRALALIGSTQKVIREDWERGAIVLRVAPSWIRFGTFEYFAHNDKPKELKALLDFAIEESYPHLKGEEYHHFFSEVVGRTARLMAHWQSVGFNHGVMNTDNMSIAGITIDYGPFAFLDDYDIRYICNHTDRRGRYSFGNQPSIGEWNLQALMVALMGVIPKEQMEKSLARYKRLYSEHYLYLMGEKFGLDGVSDEDFELIKSGLLTLQMLQVDYTLFFRMLSRYDGDRKAILDLGLYHQPMNEWLDMYDERLKKNRMTTQARITKMLSVNPKFVLKNYMIQEAIDKAKLGDFELVDVLFKIAQNPYDEHEAYERYAMATPAQFKNQKLSCSS